MHHILKGNKNHDQVLTQVKGKLNDSETRKVANTCIILQSWLYTEVGIISASVGDLPCL